MVNYYGYDELPLPEELDPELKACLRNAYRAQTRLRIFYGDPKTGEFWGDVSEGTLGKSSGREPIAILLCKKNSTGGGGILIKNILYLTYSNKASTRMPIYRHPELASKELSPEDFFLHSHNGPRCTGCQLIITPTKDDNWKVTCKRSTVLHARPSTVLVGSRNYELRLHPHTIINSLDVLAEGAVNATSIKMAGFDIVPERPRGVPTV